MLIDEATIDHRLRDCLPIQLYLVQDVLCLRRLEHAVLDKKFGKLLILHDSRYPVRNSPRSSAQVPHCDRDYFFGRGEAGHYLADAVLAECAHAELARSLAQQQGRAAFVDHVAHVVVDLKNFEDAHSTLVADLTTSVASHRLHDLRLG